MHAIFQPVNKDTPMTAYMMSKYRFTSIGIPIINLSRSDDRLMLIIGIRIPIRRCLLREKRPWLL